MPACAELVSDVQESRRERLPDAAFPARPYPGGRPAWSFVHIDGLSHPLLLIDGRWTVGGTDLDQWLAKAAAPPLAGRLPVLAYGSNACPPKISWLRAAHGLSGPVVVLRARFEGLAAVWAAGRRLVDDQRPATLSALAGVVEQHAVWLATPDQIAALDGCEGRGVRYDLAVVHSGRVMLEDDSCVDEPLGYVGRAAIRMPLLVGGRPVRCAEVPQPQAAALVGEPAASDGLDRTVLSAAPSRESP